jgi:hypothetical protein
MNKINRYECSSCGGELVTVDKDDGTTPYFLKCRVTKGCAGTMQSGMYLVNQTLIPTHEWYKPDTGEFDNLTLPMREHVNLGGLLLRPITGVEVDHGQPVKLSSSKRRKLKRAYEEKLLQLETLAGQLDILQYQRGMLIGTEQGKKAASTIDMVKKTMEQLRGEIKQIENALGLTTEELRG